MNAAEINELLQKVLECYSPDDTATDYQDKIRGMMRYTATPANHNEHEYIRELKCVIADLKLELEQYKKDAERYQWLRAKAVERREYEVNEAHAEQDFPVLVMRVIVVFDDDKSKFDNDIDTAMQKEIK